ncbi:hypothetical protein OS493_025657 [Desmophyllum pertusum]|uniref:Metalloendopeptidase n=1 Tax=Desmophyllum pertusum TaxID=174260 RepID=A0A9X0D8F3_9CNID|nr:hypothetical protein OS493_025657 [Desmophyllum pertusum]
MNVPESEHLQHGDMIPNPSRAGHKLNKWPGGIFLYEFHSSIANEPQAVKVIKEVMAYYERITCIKFRKRTNERCFVQFTRRNDKAGCSSNVGRICWPGGQHLNLAKGCWSKGVVIHEIAHAIGFLHEQDRPDRDQYVKIIKANLQDGWKNVLDQPKDVHTNYDTSGTPYDYLSIMHYTQTAFAKRDRNGRLLTTIEIKDKSFTGTTGNKHDFSRWDVEEINRFYKCSGHTNPPTTKPPTCGK